MSAANRQFLPSNIRDFYAGKTVAITGGTGFVGQCVVEKLLRCCPEIKKILILLRKKRNLNAHERVSQLLELPIFDHVKQAQPDFEKKVVPVYANLEEDNLGLDDDSVKMIQREVNIFIHSAATLRFDEHLRCAFKLNTLAVRYVVNLCRGIENLEALVHVSTAYSYCNLDKIGEEVYQTGWDFDKLHSAMQWMTDEMITKLTPDILRERPNTYTLTKAFGEEVIVKEGEGLPICIVRPSIIGASYQEPIPGWCTNLNGVNGIIVAGGKGLLHSLRSYPSLNLDVIPVDFVVNGIVAAGWKTALSCRTPKFNSDSSGDENDNYLSKVDTIAKSLHCIPEVDSAMVHRRRKSVPIYNITMGENNIKISDWRDLCLKYVLEYPFDSIYQIPSFNLVENKFSHRIQTFIRDYIPAFCMDAVLRILNQKTRMLYYHQRIQEMAEVLRFFTTKQWEWEKRSVLMLQKEMDEDDQKKFDLTTDDIDWDKYTKDFVIGSKKFIMKEKSESYTTARRKLMILRLSGYGFQLLSWMIVWRVLVSRSSLARNMWRFTIMLLYKMVNYFQNLAAVK